MYYTWSANCGLRIFLANIILSFPLLRVNQLYWEPFRLTWVILRISGALFRPNGTFHFLSELINWIVCESNKSESMWHVRISKVVRYLKSQLTFAPTRHTAAGFPPKVLSVKASTTKIDRALPSSAILTSLVPSSPRSFWWPLSGIRTMGQDSDDGLTDLEQTTRSV